MEEKAISLEELEKLVRENPQDINAKLDLAIAYGEKQMYDSAIDILESAISIDEDNPVLHYNLGVVYGMKLMEDLDVSKLWEDHTDEEKLFQTAILEYQKALELDPDYIEAYNNLGVLYELKGWKQKALEVWEKSLSLEPNQKDIKENIKSLKLNL